MAKGAEKVLFCLLTEVESIETLILEGLNREWIPSAELREVYDWAVHQYRLSGNLTAPTPLMFLESEVPGYNGKSYAEVLLEHGIAIDEVPDEPVSWVIDEMRGRYVAKATGEYVREVAEEVTKASTTDKSKVFVANMAKGVQIAIGLQTKRNVFEMAEHGEDILTDYERRAREGNTFRGLQLGLPAVDAHMNGLHEGELMVLAAPPKGSKSYMLARIALEEFRQQRSVALFTLENSIPMTRDRIACLATGVHPKRFESGECEPAEIEAMQEFVHGELAQAERERFYIISPAEGARTAEAMVSEAQIRGVDSLLIDQLTFVTPANQNERNRYLQIREIMHTLKTMISTGPQPIPCVLAHQLNRESIKAARKAGRFYMDDLAEGSEAERTADWVFSMWQSDDARQINQFLFQILASRRRDIKNWIVNWDIETGMMNVAGEADLSQ